MILHFFTKYTDREREREREGGLSAWIVMCTVWNVHRALIGPHNVPSDWAFPGLSGLAFSRPKNKLGLFKKLVGLKVLENLSSRWPGLKSFKL